MKKSIWVAFGVMGLSLIVLLLAVVKVNSGKGEIVITEEVLSGEPSAAAGITLETASHWDNHLFWNTVYTIGSGEEAKSVFTFSGEKVEWSREEGLNAHTYSLGGAGFGSAYTGIGTPVRPEDFPFPEIIRAVAERTKPGEAHTETVRISDYVQNYPLDFDVEGSPADYGDHTENIEFLTELFHISTARDRMKLTTEKDGEGILTGISSQMVADEDEIMIMETSGFGKEGCYYAYNCEKTASGKAADRGQNSGIFYLPFRQRDGWLVVEVTQMRKVCDLPEKSLPEGMLLDNEESYLYLVVRGEENHYLCVYALSGEIPVLEQMIPIRGNDRLTEGADSGRPQTWSDDLSLIPVLRRIRMVDGGLLITWNDNNFAFVTEEEGQWRLWCSGTFPDDVEQEYEMVREKPFPGEQGCVFDGERLVLAAFETWESLNVVVTAYDKEGELYCGLYRHSGGMGPYRDEPYQEQLLPVGQDNWKILSDRHPRELYIKGTDTPVEPLRVSFEENP